MKFSDEVLDILNQSLEYCHDHNLEYVTPEVILIQMLSNPDFVAAVETCGGDGELLKRDLLQYLEQYVAGTTKVKPELSRGVNVLLAVAEQSAVNCSAKTICLRHLLHSFWSLDDSYAAYFMEKQGLDDVQLQQALADLADRDAADDYYAATVRDDGEEEGDYVRTQNGSQAVQYAPCLNDTLKNANPLIGREGELDRTIQVLCRRDKNNPLHIGEPGVGKTAITYGLVRLIQEGKVPAPLKDAKIFALDLGAMLAGTQYRGDFEKRLKGVLAAIGKEKLPVIYIDEIHNLCGAGAVGEGSMDASNMLKPYLADGRIRFIGATTFEEYKKYFEKNKSLVRRFQNIEIKEPNEEETIAILDGLKARYEKFHDVRYGDGVIDYIVKMSAKYIHERFLPDKAIDVLDEAGAYCRLHPGKDMEQIVDKYVVNQVLAKICRVPVETVKTEDLSGLAELETRLKQKVFGQDEAITQVVNAVKFSKAGLLADNKPLASLLFVGPTGVGKTEIAKSLAEELGVKLIRFDMSEYGEKHTVAKLIGSPAGYVGYEEGGLLTEAVRKTPSAVLLLDEIEKAHPSIYNVLLQVMDYATLTDNQGRRADFRNIVLIMTSNAGASQMGKNGLGFLATSFASGTITTEVQRVFQPEFRNRLDRTVVFNCMDDDMAKLVVDKKLGELAQQLLSKHIIFTADTTAKMLVQSKGISKLFGAREVDRVIRNEIKPLFVDEMLFGKLKEGGTLRLTTEAGAFAVELDAKPLDAERMA